MNQSFEVGPIKIIEDEDGFGVARQLEKDKSWEVVASFKYPVDAVRYFTDLIFALGQMPVQMENILPEQQIEG